ncbi:MAG: hypothetical protein ACM31O_01465 [Bacteroidota bacterium]
MRAIDFLASVLGGFVGAAIAIFIFIMMLIGLFSPAKAHDWYPIECCAGYDCAPVDKSVMAGGPYRAGMLPLTPSEMPTMVVTTRNGTAPVTAETSRRESKDNRLHACIRDGKVVCLFVPPGI